MLHLHELAAVHSHAFSYIRDLDGLPLYGIETALWDSDSHAE